MKIRNLLVLVAASCMLIFTSCNKDKGKGGIPDHLKIIPASSMGVMTINAKELVEKGGLNKYKDFEIYKKLHQELVKYEPEATKLMDEFLKDTRVTGLNLDQIYMYVQKIGEYHELTAFTFGVDNADKVGKWFTKLNQLNSYDEDDELEIVKADGYSYLRIDYSTLLIWDKDKAILFNGLSEHRESSIPSFETLLTFDEENNITTNPDFMESYNAKKDFTFWFSFKRIAELGDQEEFDELLSVWGEEWKNASMDFSMNFTNEKAALSASIWPSSLMENFHKQYPILRADFDESLLRYFPKNFFATMKVSLNIQEYYKLIVEKLNAMEDVEENGNYNRYFNFDELLQLRSIITNEDVARIINLFKGDIIADIFGFQEGLIPMPQFGIAVTIEGEQAFNHLIDLLPESIALTKAGSYYSYSIPQVTTIYAGQKGDVMYITNTQEAIDNFYAQGYKENLGSSTISSLLKDSPILYSLNLDISGYPAMATSVLRQSMGSMEYGILAAFMEPFASLNIMQASKNTGELNIMLKEKKENSLKVIFKTIDSRATSFMGL